MNNAIYLSLKKLDNPESDLKKDDMFISRVKS